jgi:excisionase family DNA binding protein
MKQHYTVKEVAQILRHDAQTIRKMIRTGRINAFKIGSGTRRSPYLIAEEELERLSVIGYEENMKQLKEGLRL